MRLQGLGGFARQGILKEFEMDHAKWADRDAIDQALDGVDYSLLEYDPDTGLYCLGDSPYTGIAKTRTRTGNLRGLNHLVGGVDDGVAVAWYENGQLELYSEMAGDVYHGWHLEWNEDGTLRARKHYTHGRQSHLL
jgi:hypothetical protein